MNKKLSIAFTSFLALLIVIPSTSFALWYFNEGEVAADSTQNNKSSPAVDNIEENYSFAGSHKQDITYTIYLFPSAIYMNEYHNYLNNVEGSVLPEELFNSSNNSISSLVYSYDESTGNVTESYDSTDLGTQGAKYLNYVSTNYNTNDKHLSNDSITSDNLTAVKYNYDYSREQYALNTGTTYTNTWGNKTTDENSDNYPLYDSRDTSEGRNNRFDGSYIFEDDRFGYWKYKDVKTGETGRYSPIKITVKNSLSQAFYAQLPEPCTSMGDGFINTKWSHEYSDEWYNLEFSGWSFMTSTDTDVFYDRYKFTNSGSVSVNSIDFSKTTKVSDSNYLLDEFKSFDVQNLFDLSQDLSTYADENNVIRLFPIFSGGKCYDITSSTIVSKEDPDMQLNKDLCSVSDPSLSHGGLASSYIIYTDENGNEKKKYLLYNGNANYAQTKIYNSASSPWNREAISWVYFSTLKNFYYSSDETSNIKMYAASNKEESSGVFLGAYNTYNTNDTVNNYFSDYMSSYGEGLYNIYLFYTHQYISSVSQLTTPHTDYKQSWGNAQQIFNESQTYLDAFICNAGIEGSAHLMNGHYSALSRKEYNFGKSWFGATNQPKIDTYDDTEYMNYLLQTPSEKYSYYKTNFTELENNDLSFIPATQYSNSGTFYGDFYTSKFTNDSQKNNLGQKLTAGDGTRQINSQFVVAIEKVKDTKLVNSDDFNSSNWKSYNSLLTNSTLYVYADDKNTRLDNRKLYYVFSMTFKVGDPVNLYLSSLETSKVDVSNYDGANYSKLYLCKDESTELSSLSESSIYESLISSDDFNVSSSSITAKNAGTYNFVFYLNDDNEYEIYTYKHRSSFVRLYINDEYKTHSSSSTNSFYVDSYSEWGLLWEMQFESSSETLSRNSSGDKYATTLEAGSFNNISGNSTKQSTKETLLEALVRYFFNNDPNNTNGYTGARLIDNSTDYVVATFNFGKGTDNTDTSKSSLKFTNGSNSFSVIKNHMLYLDLF